MFYYLYEIKNNLNGKIYIGVHKTKKMNDNYMGSGKVILAAIEKYGIDNFTKTILETFNNAEEMYKREKEIVTEDFLKRIDVYNLRRGGFGGFDYINTSGIPKFKGKKHTAESRAKMGHIFSNEEIKILSNRMKGNKNNPKLWMTGSDHPAAKSKTSKHKEKLRTANLGKKHNVFTCPQCGKSGGERAIKRWHKTCAGVTQW